VGHAGALVAVPDVGRGSDEQVHGLVFPVARSRMSRSRGRRW
jgi:hypothetical protein